MCVALHKPSGLLCEPFGLLYEPIGVLYPLLGLWHDANDALDSHVEALYEPAAVSRQRREVGI